MKSEKLKTISALKCKLGFRCTKIEEYHMDIDKWRKDVGFALSLSGCDVRAHVNQFTLSKNGVLCSGGGCEILFFR